jgi:hypothetical protein
MLNNATSGGAAAKEGAAATAGAGAQAKSYHVMPKGDVKLDAHVGHTVELTGTVDQSKAGTTRGTTGATAGAPGAAGGSAGKSADMPHLTVTAMKHVSAKCGM